MFLIVKRTRTLCDVKKLKVGQFPPRSAKLEVNWVVKQRSKTKSETQLRFEQRLAPPWPSRMVA